MAAGVALLGLLLSYALGFSAGAARTEARLAEESRLQDADAAGQPEPIVDPLRRTVIDPDGRTQTPGRPRDAVRDAAGSAGRADRSAGGSATPKTPVMEAPAGDPREAGKYYFVLAHASVEKARRAMVDFLRANGLDAHVVRDHNGTLRKVIVLPGFTTKDAASSPELRQFRERVREAGFKWARQARGNRDFGDAYLELFRP